MCGRYTLTVDSPVRIKVEYGFEAGGAELQIPEASWVSEWQPRYNIAPGQTAPVIRHGERSAGLAAMRWGLIPSWAKDEKIAYKTINARAETLAEKPSFREALKRRRCLVPVDGFYEWKAQADVVTKKSASKTPMWIRAKSETGVFFFAGLWESWQGLETFTIVTTEANPFMRPIHDRMPVILGREEAYAWIKPGLDAPIALLKPYHDGGLIADAVSTLVNSPRNEGPELLATLKEKSG